MKKTLRIALIGYGRMGHEVERLANEKGHSIVARYDVDNLLTRKSADEKAEVYIEFTVPGSTVENIKTVAALGKPLVVGTTGWSDRLPEVEKTIRAGGSGLIHASNFSLGMNIFLSITEFAARLFDQFVDYDPFIHEVHHRGKVDSPSGTALVLGETLLRNIRRKTQLVTERCDDRIGPESLHVSSTRAGSVPGTHTVAFDSLADSIELNHVARNRSGFALGALFAAEWIIGKRGIFTMSDLMSDILRSKG